MPTFVDQKRVIDRMMMLDPGVFKEMNLGGRCWYFSRVWGLICLTPPVRFQQCSTMFFDLVSKCEDRAVDSFLGWIIGPGFARADLLAQTKSISHGLLPSLWGIVYDYLAVPCSGLIRREILSLI